MAEKRHEETFSIARLLLCFVISQDELHGGRLGSRKNFKNSRVWVSILGFWRCCGWLNGNFSLNSFQHFMKFQEMVEKITNIQLKIPGIQRNRLRIEKFPNRHTSISAHFPNHRHHPSSCLHVQLIANSNLITSKSGKHARVLE